MSWESDFEEYLGQISDEPINGLFKINNWFGEHLDIASLRYLTRKIRIGHITVVKQWVDQYRFKRSWFIKASF